MSKAYMKEGKLVVPHVLPFHLLKATGSVRN